VKGQLVHVERSGRVNRLIVTDLSGGDAKLLLEFEGLGAVVAAPAADSVIFSAAPDPRGAPYRGVALVPLDGGPIHRLSEDLCLAFHWSEADQQLLYVRSTERDGLLAWHSVRLGESSIERVRFWPTREMHFALHFFEQFATTHPFISADGQYLLFCGHPEQLRPDRAPPGVYVFNLTRDDSARLLDHGSFACFAPADGV
jgi:hypothetical protein